MRPQRCEHRAKLSENRNLINNYRKQYYFPQTKLSQHFWSQQSSILLIFGIRECFHWKECKRRKALNNNYNYFNNRAAQIVPRKT